MLQWKKVLACQFYYYFLTVISLVFTLFIWNSLRIRYFYRVKLTCMRKHLIFTALAVFSLTGMLLAQEVKEPVNSGELIEKGIKLHDDGDYEGALEFYEQVPRNDTNYMLALYERSNTLFLLKKYDEAIEAAREGLKKKSEYDHNFYVTLGNSLDENDEAEEALKVYEEAIKRFPNNHLIHFNRAVCFNKLERKQEAVDELKLCLRLNPLHAGTHLILGSIAASRGKLVESMLCLNTFLLLEPFSERAQKAVVLLNSLTDEKIEPEDDKKIIFSEEGDDFSEIEVLLIGRVAMSKKYKVPVKLDLPIIKQNHLLFSQFKDHPDKYKNGFFTQFYTAFYVTLLKQGWFDEFSLFELVSIDNAELQKMITKKKNAITNFIKWAIDEYKKDTRDHEVMFEGKMQLMSHWYYRASFLESIGNVNKVTQKPVGNWESYNAAGSLDSKSYYTIDGKKTDTWTEYFVDGELKGELTYVNDAATGFYKGYYANGKMRVYNDIKDGQLEGLARDYWLDGTTRAETPYKSSKREGAAKIYYAINSLHYDLSYSNGELNGKVKEFYPDGKLKMEGEYKDGFMSGEFTYYWPDGKLESKYTYVNGKANGPFENYFDNGQLQAKGVVKDGTIIGKYETWYKNGKPDEEHEYDENGKGNGIAREYDEDGKLYYEAEIRKDIIVNYKWIDKSGKVLKEAKEEKGELNYLFYYPEGMLRGEGLLKKGEKTGKWKYYDRMGNLVTEEVFENGKAKEITDFFKSGKVESITRYKDGEKDGLFESYFYNGKTHTKGWYVKGESQGYWYYYRYDGTIENKVYYLSDKQYGEQLEYNVKGEIDNVIDCDLEGRTIRYDYYDTSGKVYESVDFSATTGDLITHHLNGQEKFHGIYKNDLAHGKFIWHYFNGQVSTEGEYFANKKTGRWTWYTPEGKIETTGFWKNGARDSTWTDYYADGTIKSVRYYNEGDETGEWKNYYETGEIALKRNYIDGERTGTSSYYGEDGQLRMVKEFYYGDVLSVSYMMPDGSMSKPLKTGNDKIHVVTYYKNGKKADEFDMNKNEINGEYVKYHSNGALSEKSNFVEGYQEGTEETYYPNGKIHTRSNYYHDQLNGLYTSYEANGNLKSELTYVMGELHGICKYYKNGKLIKTRIYDDGTIIAETQL